MILPIVYSLVSVFIVSLISLIGLITFSIREERMHSMLFVLVALAIGSLLGDVFIHLLPDIFEHNTAIPLASGLILVGIFIFFCVERFLSHHHHGDDKEHVEKEILPVGKMIFISDGLHNFIDGLIIGASYLVSPSLGFATTLAIVIHEIPQEIGDFSIMIHAGYSRKQALIMNFLSACFAILGTILVLFSGSNLEVLQRWIVPFAAGSLLYIAMSDLIPELHKKRKSSETTKEIAWIIIGVAIMFLIRFVE